MMTFGRPVGGSVSSGTRRGRSVHRLVLASLAGGLVVGCGSEPVERAEPVRPVKTAEFGSAAFGGGLEYSGVVQGIRDAELSFEVPGRVIDFPVVEGQRVRQGTLLARLDPRDFEAIRDAAGADRSAAEADYTRYQELYAASAVSLQELEVRRRNFQVADANFRTAQKSVDDTNLYAPFNGQVARTIANEGEQVQAREPVLFFVDDSRLEAVIDIPEADALRGTQYLASTEAMGALNPQVRISSLGDRSFAAELTEFATSADPVTRTFEATFAFDPPDDASIRPGMTARVALSPPSGEYATADPSLPVGAVLAAENGAPYVWVIDRQDMTVSRTPVSIGTVFGDEIAITGGLEIGQLIATSGVHNLRPGMRVRQLESSATN